MCLSLELYQSHSVSMCLTRKKYEISTGVGPPIFTALSPTGGWGVFIEIASVSRACMCMHVQHITVTLTAIRAAERSSK